MGIFRNGETHESRSSSMSYALRWKHENFRQITLVGVLSIAVIIIILIGAFGQERKQVSLVIDGKVRSVETTESKVAHLLEEQSVKLAPQDTVSRPLE
ncbi:MAG: ubiquitin-like domain-containing protein, partial [Paenibacillus macerans]|nr:ubiquitin-like domain-containing protein [Paenibacillus macerans]